MPRKTIAGICQSHGFYTGEYCVECELNPKNEVFYTSKDKLWEFTALDGTKQVPIGTKGQWKRFMKQRGLNDDVPKYKGLDAVKQDNDKFKTSYKPVSREFVRDEIAKELQQKNLTHKLWRNK